MAKEVKDAIVEEEPVAVVEEPVDTEGTEEELSPWYVFCSTGCGFCKKAEPVIEELNKEGHDILVLDMAEPDNQQLNKELQTEYKTQCGTPWFINADTGKGICGFREKDILEKWLAGEDIPAPPRPTGPPPKTPFQGSTNKENTDWKKQYGEWLKSNEHMPETWQKQQKSASAIIDDPRPKSDPPVVPRGPEYTDPESEKIIDIWGEKMKVWQEENKHLSNLQPIDNILLQMKRRSVQMKEQMNGNAATMGQAAGVTVNMAERYNKLEGIEANILKLMKHLGVKP